MKFRRTNLGVFIAKAGIGLPTWSIVDLPIESFDQVMAVNVRGVFLGLKAAIPALRERGNGRASWWCPQSPV